MQSTTARILDANGNRGREALRVLEDYARFELNDGVLTELIKTTRHALTTAMGGWADLIIRARDSEHDVGRVIETESEYQRAGTCDVAVAAAKRAAEALRVMEEYAKTIDADRARSFERLRYTVYDIEHALAIRIQARVRLATMRLYVLLTESWCRRPWLETADEVIAGGADCIQLREKSLPDHELLARAKSLAERCRAANVLFVVNDRPDIARLSQAHGVHIGQDDLPVRDVRRIIGPDGLVGLSTHTIEHVRRAAADSPDYIAVGPMFQSKTKPQDRVPGPPFIAAACAETSLPMVAIGGIGTDNVADVLQAGASCICVCGTIVSCNHPRNATAELKTRILAAEISASNKGSVHAVQ